MNLNIGNIGVWGFRHYEYLKQNCTSTVSVMRLSGTLEGYLKKVNQEATVMLESLVRQYAKAEGVTEALKRMDQLGWIKTELMTDFHVTGEKPVEEEIDDYIRFFNEERPAYSLNYMTSVQYRQIHACC